MIGKLKEVKKLLCGLERCAFEDECRYNKVYVDKNWGFHYKVHVHGFAPSSRAPFPWQMVRT